MLFSIITISFNAEKEIESTIKSVIEQSYNDFEYIIIDGNSTDNTIDIIRKYEKNISYWQSEPDTGIYNAMNKGIQYANGEWILFMNAGDTFANNHILEKVSKSILGNHKKFEIIYGDVYKKKSNNIYLYKAEKLSLLTYRMPFSHQSCFIKKEILKNIRFNEKYRIAADFNLIRYLYLKNYTFYYLPIPFSIFDLDGVSSKQFRSATKENNKIIKETKSPIYPLDYIINNLRYVLITTKQIITNIIKR
ncbi:glycosyltransferase family 2 protein [Phocaeicola barnesiae]|uniref:glycosyltransferase family 2 protein n=1 Tax=Phocaeicola barnesiae TaxID=376804 RepID=UPI000380D7D4|nr:glycosyltransferase family 2 protein [Phocaeicola barnesiae]